MGQQRAAIAIIGTVVLLLAGCGKDSATTPPPAPAPSSAPAPAPAPPPPPGATVGQLRAVAEAADAVRKDQAKLEARVAELEAKFVALQETRDQIESDRARLQERLLRLESARPGVSRPRTTSVPPGDEAAPAEPAVPAVPATPDPSIKGSVLAADATLDIYLLSVGKLDGVKIADEFTVYRGDSFVAVVVVDKVFDDKATCTVKKIHGKPMLKSEIKVRDKVSSMQEFNSPAEEPEKDGTTGTDGTAGTSAAPKSSSVKGQVLAADNAMDIYLISVGDKDGVKIGDELTVYRGDVFIAQVVVDQVFRDKASVCVKKINGKKVMKSEIKTGDKVARPQ